MIADDRPYMDDDKDEPKLKKPRQIVDEDPNDLRAQLANEEISVKLEVEWFTDSVEQYSYVSLPSTDSETQVAHIWQILNINEKTITIPTFESSGPHEGLEHATFRNPSRRQLGQRAKTLGYFHRKRPLAHRPFNFDFQGTA